MGLRIVHQKVRLRSRNRPQFDLTLAIYRHSFLSLTQDIVRVYLVSVIDLFDNDPTTGKIFLNLLSGHP